MPVTIKRMRKHSGSDLIKLGEEEERTMWKELDFTPD